MTDRAVEIVSENDLAVVEREGASDQERARIVAQIALQNIELTDGLIPVVEDDEEEEKISKVNLTQDTVKDYLRNIGKIDLLDAAQEVELSQNIEVGLYAGKKLEELSADDPDFARSVEGRELRHIELMGKRSYDQMLTANLRLVVSLAKRYQGRGLSFEDLIQEGNLGLVRAVEKFDYTKGFKFSTYATWWIRQAITRSLADTANEIRIPVHMVEKINKIGRVQRELFQKLGREATDQEVAKEVDLTPEQVTEYQKLSRQPISMNTKLGEDQENELGDLIPDTKSEKPEDRYEAESLKKNIEHDLFSTLTEREIYVMKRRYGFDDHPVMTLDAIAEGMGLTRERVRQIQSTATKKLQHRVLVNPALAEGLREYL